MNNKQLSEQIRKIGNQLFDKTYDPNYKLLLDEASNRLENQNEWISVEERLPKDAERVLVYGEKGICFATRYKRDWMTPMRYNGEITHWMPLPEPPKMKDGAKE